MDILKALRQEEEKFLQQLSSARQQLATIRSAIKLMGGKSSGKKKRFVSKAARAKMAKAQKERWKKIKSKSA